MGKIFDALKKAERDFSGTLPAVRKGRQERGVKVDNTDKENIVSLISPNKLNNERLLDANLITYHSPQSVQSEVFKVLRTNLLFPAEGSAPKTILVTSALPGDGKSMLSANLAISIALGVEEHVLLMDCDFRKPSIHSLFGYQKARGLSEYLTQSKDLSDYLLKAPISKLSILPGGVPPANPTELLTSKKMKELLSEVSRRYDDRYVIIDSPPPSMAAETSAIARQVEGVIIVVKDGKTPQKAVTELVEQIGKEKILGFVLNFCDQSIKKYYGYGKSYYRTDKGNQSG